MLSHHKNVEFSDSKIKHIHTLLNSPDKFKKKKNCKTHLIKLLNLKNLGSETPWEMRSESEDEFSKHVTDCLWRVWGVFLVFFMFFFLLLPVFQFPNNVQYIWEISAPVACLSDVCSLFSFTWINVTASFLQYEIFKILDVWVWYLLSSDSVIWLHISQDPHHGLSL